MSEMATKDVALVLSGGSVNGVLLEAGFLRRVRESAVWPRVGWIYGTSAGALAGTMACLDRLDDLEGFLLALRPEDAFRPNRLWRLPLLGSHDYALPATVDERIGDIEQVARDLARCERELVVCATDVTDTSGDGTLDYELVYSSRSTPPEELAQAILASAAVSTLVLPVRVGDRIATDGAWARNFPLSHAYAQAGVELIVAFRYVPSYPHPDTSGLATLRRRLERFRAVPPVKALIAELREAEARDARGEPPHLLDMIRRLMRVAVLRNTVLEERLADERDVFAALRADVAQILTRRPRLAAEVDARFEAAGIPRAIPRITVRATVGPISLEPRFRRQPPWTDEAKRALIRRGWELADAELDEIEGLGAANFR